MLGLIGYAALVAGSSLELFGNDLAMIHYLPGALFELVLPIWLITRGFDRSAIVSESVEANTNEGGVRSLSTA